MDWKYLLTSFEGRISRQPFWLSVLVLFIAQWVIMIVLGMLFGVSLMGGMDPTLNPEAAASAAMSGMAPIIIISLLFLYPALAVYTKRWHDRGKSGWWTLILLIPFIGALWFLVECGFLRGTEGPNQYGNDPLA
jgi:uncharacterized membrane protein YhaH (DUF805 family)